MKRKRRACDSQASSANDQRRSGSALGWHSSGQPDDSARGSDQTRQGPRGSSAQLALVYRSGRVQDSQAKWARRSLADNRRSSHSNVFYEWEHDDLSARADSSSLPAAEPVAATAAGSGGETPTHREGWSKKKKRRLGTSGTLAITTRIKMSSGRQSKS